MADSQEEQNVDHSRAILSTSRGETLAPSIPCDPRPRHFLALHPSPLSSHSPSPLLGSVRHHSLPGWLSGGRMILARRLSLTFRSIHGSSALLLRLLFWLPRVLRASHQSFPRGQPRYCP